MIQESLITRKRSSYTYQAALAASEKMNWRVEDLIGNGKTLDFSKPFMPEALARVEPLTFLSPEEKLALNQIRGNAYLCIFGLVEEFILPFVLDHARKELNDDDYRVRALLRFAGEEAKHIHLFRRFKDEFERGFKHKCNVIGPAADIARAVLSHRPLAVALIILHIEWFTQSHYLESINDNQDLDPQFKSLLKHHWMEESQHAKMDRLLVEALSEGCTPAEINAAIEEYLEIGGMIDGGLKQQVEFDLESLTRTAGCYLNREERRQFIEVQLQANRWTYIGSGMLHPNFLETLEYLSPEARTRIEKLAPAFC
jgi:hypothetical protein